MGFALPIFEVILPPAASASRGFTPKAQSHPPASECPARCITRCCGNARLKPTHSKAPPTLTQPPSHKIDLLVAAKAPPTVRRGRPDEVADQYCERRFSGELSGPPGFTRLPCPSHTYALPRLPVTIPTCSLGTEGKAAHDVTAQSESRTARGPGRCSWTQDLGIVMSRDAYCTRASRRIRP